MKYSLHIGIAASLFGGHPEFLDKELIICLDDVAAYVEMAGGVLKSRQAIAVAVASWQMSTGQEAYNYAADPEK